MTVSPFVLTAILVAFGATISSMAGFGYAIATMPFMLMLYPPKTAVVLTLFVSSCGALIQWVRVRNHVHYKLAVQLCLGAAIGVPLGGLILAVIDPVTLKVLIGFAVLIAAILTFIQRENPDLPPRMPRTEVVLAAGFGAGVLATTVGQSGITVAFLMAWTRLDKVVVRATFVTFFLLVHVASLVTMAQSGILTREIAVTSVSLVPFYLVGLLLGDQAFRRSSQGAYRRLIVGVLTVAAVVGVVNGLTALVLKSGE